MKSGVMKARQRYDGVIMAVLISNVVSVGLLLIKIAGSGSWQYVFLVWNLFLAWLPLMFAVLLVSWLRKGRWLSWQGVLLSLLWLFFLPNSFYLATDLMHLRLSSAGNVLYDVTMFLSFTFNGFMVGLASIYLIHKELLQRTSIKRAHALITLVIALASFAIYLGRYLRWNTWDVVANPAGVLFDVTDRIINPGAHPQAFVTTATFFVLIGSVYLVAWQFVEALRSD